MLLRHDNSRIAEVDTVPAATPLKSQSIDKLGSKSGWEPTSEASPKTSASLISPKKVATISLRFMSIV